MTENLLLGILGGGNLFLFIKFLIDRHDQKEREKKAEEKEQLKSELHIIKKDGIRTQLLLLILMQPSEKSEILTVAEHYFKDLKGNWYMTSIFNKWLEDENVAKPEWFNVN